MSFFPDHKIQSIKDCIVGVNVVLGDNDYGCITDIIVEHDNSCVSLIAETDAGYFFNAIEIYQLYRSIYENVADKHYPEGSEYSRWNVGPKSKSWGSGGAVNAANIPNTARIGNESINIAERP